MVTNTIKYFLLAITFWSCHFTLFAQQTKIDSLESLLKNSKEDTGRVSTLCEYCEQLMIANKYEKSMTYALQAIELSKKLNFTKGIAEAVREIGWIYYNQGKKQDALAKLQESLKTFELLNDKSKIARGYCDIANSALLTPISKNLEYYLKALTIYEETKDTLQMAIIYDGIASFYYNVMKDYPAAEKYFSKSLDLYEQLKNKSGINDLSSYVGMAYWKEQKYQLAIDYIKKGIVGYENGKNKRGEGYGYNSLGMIYLDIGKYNLAEENVLTALKINTELNNTNMQGFQWNYHNLGKIKIKQKKFNEAVDYLLKALKMAEEADFNVGKQPGYEFLSIAYEGQRNFEKAYYYNKKSEVLKDSMYSNENSKKITEIQLAYEAEKAEKIRQLEERAKEQQHQAEVKQQKIIIYAVSGGLLLMFSLAFFILRSNRQKQKANKLLEEKNIVIEQQKEIVEEKNRDILGSIRYAKRIQTSLLPTDKYISRTLSRLNKNESLDKPTV